MRQVFYAAAKQDSATLLLLVNTGLGSVCTLLLAMPDTKPSFLDYSVVFQEDALTVGTNNEY